MARFLCQKRQILGNLIRAEVPVVAIFAFVYAKLRADVMIIFSDTSRKLGFFASFVANFMRIADPTARRIVRLIWI